MLGSDRVQKWASPTTLAELHLPPTFVSDHGIRTLANQGPMTPVEIARHWRIDDAVVVEVIDALKAQGLVQLDTGHANFERLGRVRLTEAGQAHVAAARQRTWYAGPLPVSLRDLGARTEDAAPFCSRAAVRSGLQPLAFATNQADEIGQALSGGATLWLSGAAFDEQRVIAAALGGAMHGSQAVPYAIFAAGSVMRVFDPTHHHSLERQAAEGAAEAVLRTRSDITQWVQVARPVVTLAGILPSDVLPAYDDEARFYLAPKPFAASGGLLAVLDSGDDEEALAALARLWLTPGRSHTGIVLLRSGERIEVPWRAATVLFGEASPVAVGAATAALYRVDVSALDEELLPAFVSARLDADTFPDAAVTSICSALIRGNVMTRAGAARVTRYLADRAEYEGAAFSLTPPTIDAALNFAAEATTAPTRATRAARAA